MMQCRICLHEEEELGSLIVPCICKGSMEFVHSQCLEKWRQTNAKARTHCGLCGFQYVLEKKYEDGWVWKLVEYYRAMTMWMIWNLVAMTMVSMLMGIVLFAANHVTCVEMECEPVYNNEDQEFDMTNIVYYFWYGFLTSAELMTGLYTAFITGGTSMVLIYQLDEARSLSFVFGAFCVFMTIVIYWYDASHFHRKRLNVDAVGRLQVKDLRIS